LIHSVLISPICLKISKTPCESKCTDCSIASTICSLIVSGKSSEYPAASSEPRPAYATATAWQAAPCGQDCPRSQGNTRSFLQPCCRYEKLVALGGDAYSPSFYGQVNKTGIRPNCCRDKCPHCCFSEDSVFYIQKGVFREDKTVGFLYVPAYTVHSSWADHPE